ncbi:chemotaxis protein CheB [Desulfobacterales bacterium HSG2]|nr:chemotaxis protein CheB [Desulfobacterales bacterium HSG2]
MMKKKKTESSDKKKSVAEEKPAEKKKAVSEPKPVVKEMPEKPEKEEKTANAEPKESVGFPIVGMGASAGGLDSFEKFFTHIPPDSGMAFVLVQHLAPDHKSFLPEILKNFTGMETDQAKDGTKVRPNCIYVIQPGKNMGILNGVLYLIEQTGAGPEFPIDHFFESLALDQKEKGICIVFSGTGSDGTLGLKAIRKEGGLVMVQDPESAQYDGMPKSAVATGLADHILSPDKMPAQLTAFIHHADKKETGKFSSEDDLNHLNKIFMLVRHQTTHDFSFYKKASVSRRIERRMGINRIDNLADYVFCLQQNPKETEALFKDLLIGVSSFFRDMESFEILKENIIPPLFENRPLDQAVRIWVPGCSTGEEAYSIGMLIREHLEFLKKKYRVQIFATDINDEAIDIARTGIYPSNIISKVPEEYLQRFFTQAEDGKTYQIDNNIREMMIFAEQNITEDTPFSNIDLISCRNLLIYMEPELQKKTFSLILYSLNKGGYLLLGTSEYLSNFAEELFVPVKPRHKLYRYKGDEKINLQMRILETRQMRYENMSEKKSGKQGVTDQSSCLDKMAEKALLKNYKASCVIVNEQYEILHTYGRTGKYLEPAIGPADWTILKMARKGLGRELTIAIGTAITQKKEIRCENIQVDTNGDIQPVNLTIKPAINPSSLQPVIIVIFEDIDPVKTSETAGPSEPSDNETILSLQQELRNTRERLQSTTEELETANEELQSTNEELQASNEELRSSNEELRTSQEELQSLNEELLTTNSQLNRKIEDMIKINNDIKNLMDSIDMGIIFVDLKMRVQRFTPPATKIMSLLETDFDRPLTHVVSNLDYDIVPDIKSVLNTLVPITKEVATKDKHSYMLRFSPYRTVENTINGVVITSSDFTNQRLATVVMDSNDAISVQDTGGNITAWNRGAEKMYGYSEAEALEMNVRDIVPDGRKKEALAFIQKLQEEELESFETQRLTKDGRILDVWLTVTKLVDDQGKTVSIATTERDVTEQRKIEANLRRLAAVVTDSNDAITVQDTGGNITAWNRGAEKMYGYSEAEALEMNVRDIVPDDRKKETLTFVQKLQEGEEAESFKTRRLTKDGRVLDVWLTVTKLVDDQGKMVSIATTEHDITKIKEKL